MRVFRFPAVGRLARALALLGMTLLIMTGCASLDGTAGASAGAGSPTAPAVQPVFDPSPAPASPSPSPGNAMMPRMIVPATGGPAVLGIPLGGNMFQPATGGPPVFGIPLFP
jgi:hypothetical protein